MNRNNVVMSFLILANVGYASERLYVKVTDDEGLPVSNATVSVGFSTSNVLFGGGYSSKSKGGSAKAKTDINGHATVKFNCTSSEFGWHVEADGFYRSDIYTEHFKGEDIIVPPAFVKVVLHEHEKHGAVTLYRKRNPQPMYAYGMYESLRVRWPRENGRYGFDLRLFDWVAPHGNGEIADFYFVRNVMEKKSGDCVGHLEFEKKCGAYVRKQTGSKSFPSTYGADTNAIYSPCFQFMFLRDGGAIDYGNVIGKDEYMVLRTRVNCDGDGNVKEANYSKILGPFGTGLHSVEAMETVFNSHVNDSNLELDSSRNLVERNRSCGYPP